MKLSDAIDLERGNWDWPGEVETSLKQWAEQARALEAELVEFKEDGRQIGSELQAVYRHNSAMYERVRALEANQRTERDQHAMRVYEAYCESKAIADVIEPERIAENERLRMAFRDLERRATNYNTFNLSALTAMDVVAFLRSQINQSG